MSVAVAIPRVQGQIPWRSLILAAGYFALALLVFWIFGLHTLKSTDTTLQFNGPTATRQLPGLVVPVGTFSTLIAAIIAFLGGIQLARLGRGAWIFGIAVFFFVAAFMVWAARDESLDVIYVIENALLSAVPIAIGAMSGVLCERSGVINIAIEGEMLLAAFMSTLLGGLTGQIWVGLLGGILTGAAVGWILAVLALKYGVDQIIAGFVIDVFATGFTSYLHTAVMERFQDINSSGLIPNLNILNLNGVPAVGTLIFGNNVFIYLAVIMVVVVHIGLFKTRWGLRVRSVGEHPIAAATVGIDPIRIRYFNVILGGAVAGVGGTYFTLGATGRFDPVMTSGYGFIALVAVILGGWKPVGAALAALLFGFAVSLQTVLGIFNVNIDPNLLSMIPYLATILAVAGVVGRTRPPAADGRPYIKG